MVECWRLSNHCFTLCGIVSLVSVSSSDRGWGCWHHGDVLLAGRLTHSNFRNKPKGAVLANIISFKKCVWKCLTMMRATLSVTLLHFVKIQLWFWVQWLCIFWIFTAFQWVFPLIVTKVKRPTLFHWGLNKMTVSCLNSLNSTLPCTQQCTGQYTVWDHSFIIRTF